MASSLFYGVEVRPERNPSSLQHNARVATQLLMLMCREGNVAQTLRVVCSCQLMLAIFNRTPEMRRALQRRISIDLSQKSHSWAGLAPFHQQIPLSMSANQSFVIFLPKYVGLVEFSIVESGDLKRGNDVTLKQPFIKALDMPIEIEDDASLAGEVICDGKAPAQHSLVLLRAFERIKYLVVHNCNDCSVNALLYLEKLQSKDDFAAFNVSQG